MTGVVLGIGRALGEAMAINMVAGGSVNLPLPFNSVRFLTTQIVSEMSYAEGLHREVLFTVGLVLFIFIMIINLVLAQVERKEPLKMTGSNTSIRTKPDIRRISLLMLPSMCVQFFPLRCFSES